MVYKDIREEPIPERFLNLLERLERQEQGTDAPSEDAPDPAQQERPLDRSIVAMKIGQRLR